MKVSKIQWGEYEISKIVLGERVILGRVYKAFDDPQRLWRCMFTDGSTSRSFLTRKAAIDYLVKVGDFL